MMRWIQKGSIEEIWPNKWHSSHSINKKRYTKVDKYKALFAEKENGIESIEYEEKLIDYDEDYEGYDPYQDWDGSEIFY